MCGGLVFKEIKDIRRLIHIISSSNPDKSKDCGFWLFDEAIKKDPNYAMIGSGIWKIRYWVVSLEGKTCGLISHSDNHILGIQTLKEFKGRHLLGQYLEWFIFRMRYGKITLRPYSESLVDIYRRHGFVVKEKGLLVYEAS